MRMLLDFCRACINLENVVEHAFTVEDCLSVIKSVGEKLSG